MYLFLDISRKSFLPRGERILDHLDEAGRAEGFPELPWWAWLSPLCVTTCTGSGTTAGFTSQMLVWFAPGAPALSLPNSRTGRAAAKGRKGGVEILSS